MELTIVLVILSIVVFFVVRSFRPAEAQALQQAERLRDDLRHAQMLAMTQGTAKQLKLGAPASPASCAGSHYYVIDCTVAAADPCATAPNNAITDPRLSGGFFCVTLEAGLALAGPGFNLHFDPLGRPRNATTLIAANANYAITGGGVARSAVVTPLTGFVTAQ